MTPCSKRVVEAVAVVVGVRVERDRAGPAAVAGLTFSGPTVGEAFAVVKRLDSFVVSTRRRKRLAVGLSLLTTMYFSSDFGTTTVIFFLVERPGLDEQGLAPSRLNSTVFLALPERKFLPWIVSVSPTVTFFGVTLVMTGVLVGRARAGGHDERAERCRDDGAAQQAGAGSSLHRSRVSTTEARS